MLRFLIESSTLSLVLGFNGKGLPWYERPVSFFQLDPPTSTRERNVSLDSHFLLGFEGSPAEKPRLSRRCGFSVVAPTFPASPY
jgi:hypothetical protein